jgi:hypothetical protein
MTAPSGFPLGTLYFITNITRSNPGVVTLATVADPTSIAVALGQTVTISKVKGMMQVNDNRYQVGNFNAEAQTFSLYSLNFTPVDTTAYTPYIAGGEMNIISFPATATNPPGLMYNM